jgi:hypothetical protein
MTPIRETRGRIEIEIRRHARIHTHFNGIVTTSRGYCYYCTWADEPPSVDTVDKAWREDRKAFLPFYNR